MAVTSVAETRFDLGNHARENRPPDPLIDITDESRRLPAFSGHERVLEFSDELTGVSAFIAIHDTTLGPALGGCRAVCYSTRAEALTDALRLSRGMTYKASLAELDLGGGKTVVAVDHDAALSESFFRNLGRAIEALGGDYITAEDAGTSVREMDWISRETDHVIGTSARGGDPSPMTALGVFAGIRAAVRHRLGTDDLSGIAIAVQGLGHVGTALCEKLAPTGARLIVADVDAARVEAVVARLGAEAVSPEEIHGAEADVFVPCALGAILNGRTIPELRCAVVAGSANNQLAEARDGLALKGRGILYAPDYLGNAGGLISVALALCGHDPNGPTVRARLRNIGNVLAAIFARSAVERATPEAVAGRMAEERLAAGGISPDVERKSA